MVRELLRTCQKSSSFEDRITEIDDKLAADTGFISKEKGNTVAAPCHILE